MDRGHDDANLQTASTTWATALDSLTDQACGRTSNDRIWGNVAIDHRPRRNDRPTSNRHPLQNNCPRSDPNVIFNDDGRCLDRRVHRRNPIVMGCRGQHRVRSDHDVTSNGNRGMRPHLNKRRNRDPLSARDILRRLNPHGAINTERTAYRSYSTLPVLLRRSLRQRDKTPKQAHQSHSNSIT